MTKKTKHVAKETTLQFTKEVLITLGHTIAESFINADTASNQTKRELLLSAAEAHAYNPDRVEAILTGYADTWKEKGYNDTIVRNRKSEAKRVFECVALTQASGDNLDILKQFEGNYNDFIATCRQLIKEAKGETESTEHKTRENKRELTENQLSEVEKAIKRATLGQLGDFVEQASVSILEKAENSSIVGLNGMMLINSIASNMLTNDELDAYTRTAFESIVELTTEALNKIQDVLKESREALRTIQEAVETEPVTK